MSTDTALTDTALTEVEHLRSFIIRCTQQIEAYRADAAAQSRPELSQVYAEIADIWQWQKADLERRLAALEATS